MATIYGIPGLGTDERVFSNLFPLLEQQGHTCNCLRHIEPLHRKESIADYAQRLVEDLPPLGTMPFYLLGLSIGGPIAVEIAKKRPDCQLILISTFKQTLERPFLFKVGCLLPLDRLLPLWFTYYMVPVLMRWLRIGSREESALLGAMFRTQTAAYFAWGRHAIVSWKNEEVPANYWHINGDRDHVFNSALPYVSHRIAGGTHNMVLNRAEDIVGVLAPLLVPAIRKNKA